MASLQWDMSHAVFVTEIDDDHKEIFEALSDLPAVLSGTCEPSQLRKATQRLTTRIVEHFAHEERLMLAARYDSLKWHKRQHDNARRWVVQLVARIESGDAAAGPELVERLTSWLHEHTRLADMMMGAFLRNHRRVGKLTIWAGTKPADACEWVDATGEKLRGLPVSKTRTCC